MSKDQREVRQRDDGAPPGEGSHSGYEDRGPLGVLRLLQGRHGREHGHPGQQGHGAHRAFGLRQEHLYTLPEPDARGDPRRARRGTRDAGRPGHLRQDLGPGEHPAPRRYGLPETQPVLQVHLRERGVGGQDQRLQRRHGRAGGALPQARRPLGRGQGPPQRERARPLRRPAAAAVHRQDARRGARGDPDGRAGERPRPRLDPEDRRHHGPAQARATRWL